MIKVILLKACYKAYSITREPIDVLLILLIPLCIVSLLDMSQRVVNLVAYSTLALQLLWLILVVIVLIDRSRYIEYVFEPITKLDTFRYEGRIIIVTRSGSYWVDQETYDLLDIALNKYSDIVWIMIPKKVANIPIYAEREVDRRLKYESIKVTPWYLHTMALRLKLLKDYRSYVIVKKYMAKNKAVLSKGDWIF